MERQQVYNNTIGYFLELYMFIRDFSGIEKDHASFIDEDTETNSNYMTYPRWQRCQSQGLVTTAVLRAYRFHQRSATGEDLGRGDPRSALHHQENCWLEFPTASRGDSSLLGPRMA